MKRAALKDIADINPRYRENGATVEKVAFIPMAGVSEEGHLHEVEERDFAEVRKGYTYFEEGDVLLAKITPCMENGKVAVARNLPRPIGFGSTEFHVLRPGNELDRDYLFYAVWNQEFRRIAASNMTGSAGQKRVPVSFLKDYKIPLPPLEEQKRIAAILDKADALRRKRAQALQLTDQFLQSLFLDMFGDPVTNPKGLNVVELESLCKRITDGTHQPPKWADSGIPFLFVSNIKQDGIDFLTQKFISEVTWKELTARCPIEQGDILYTTVGSYGNTALVETDRRFAFQRHIAHVKPDSDQIRPAFLAAMMKSPGVRKQCDQLVRGVAQKTLNLRELKQFLVFAPDLDLQDAFLRTLKAVQAAHANQRNTRTDIENLAGSLAQRAFQGEL